MLKSPAIRGFRNGTFVFKQVTGSLSPGGIYMSVISTGIFLSGLLFLKCNLGIFCVQ